MLLVLVGVPTRAGEKQKLPPKYREWLEKDVAYIITRPEKEVFLTLKDDDARDQFIERFWELRNPDPGSPTNTFKEEHYRRIAYADETFGHESGTPGWRTDQGRTYIVLGPPEQREFYRNYQDIWPTEVWFYSSTHPALPPFFYIIFFQRDGIGPYRFYSPYFDGPENLVTYRGDTRQQSLLAMTRGVSEEFARHSLSLIPGEPVDLQSGRASLQSDVMLSTIRDLANHPFSLQQLDLRRLAQSVTASLVFKGETLGAMAVPLRDKTGHTRLEYLLRFSQPEDFTLAENKNKPGNYYYNVGVRAQVFAPDNKPIFTQERTISREMDRAQEQRIESKIFGYEDWLPLPPGKYRVEFQLTNWLKKLSYRAIENVEIPEPPTAGLQVSEIVPFASAASIGSPDADFAPFSVGGVKFTPLLHRDMNLAPGRDLKFFYQIWSPPPNPEANHGSKLAVEYAYGRPGVPTDAKVIQDEVSKELFDPHGSLVNGKELPIGEWPPGAYQLTLTLADPASEKKAYSALSFRIAPSDPGGSYWDIFDGDGIRKDAKAGLPEYERALCYLAQEKKELAEEWLRKSLALDSSREDARTTLVDLDFSRQAFSEVAKLASQIAITGKTEDRTILQMAESLDKVGQTQKAIQLLESALNLKAPTGPLYLTLASYYQRVGDAHKAQELEKKGKSLMVPQSPSS